MASLKKFQIFTIFPTYFPRHHDFSKVIMDLARDTDDSATASGPPRGTIRHLEFILNQCTLRHTRDARRSRRDAFAPTVLFAALCTYCMAD